MSPARNRWTRRRPRRALVDTLLLDSGNPRLAVKELGGTGRVHDWEQSRRICDTVRVPVLLAGGLHPGNARAAMAQVEPAGLDVCSGLRLNGRLDAGKLRDFFSALPLKITENPHDRIRVRRHQ